MCVALCTPSFSGEMNRRGSPDEVVALYVPVRMRHHALTDC